MALFNLRDNHLKEIEKTTYGSEKILERKNIQVALRDNIQVVAPDTLVISEEFSEWEDSDRRIDLLAIDRNGSLVVIELKRSETGDYMELQALRYAAMVSTLTFSRAVEIYKRYLAKNNQDTDAQEKLLEFLEWDEPREEDFALETRIVLVSADFGKELTTSVMWLNERNIDIRCIRITPYSHNNEILVDVQPIIPLPEAESYQVKIKQQTEQRREARKSSKDYTRYTFNGATLNKRKLALNVVRFWFDQNHPEGLLDLLEAFPTDQCGSIVMAEQEAIEMHERHGIPRHFLGDEEILVFPDGSRYAISNQWGKTNIVGILKIAEELGYKIEEES